MRLLARFRLQRGDCALDVDFAVAPGETLALVGPNGAGKSTLLAAIAGLLRIDDGAIALGERVLDGGRNGAFALPEARRVGLVFQQATLFPHLVARDNVAFGLRARGVAKRVADAVAMEWLQRVGLAHLARRRPATLSGGEAQRVALARAFACGPDVLLLDEPLAAVDASARLQLRRDLRRWLDDFPGPRIVVAHDAIDAFAFADRVAVLEAGRLVQSGSVAEICSRPRSRYVADLVGLNLLRGTVRAGVLAVREGASLVVAGPDGDAVATVHPRAIALYRSRPDGTPRNVWQASIEGLESAGDRVRVRLGGPLALVAEVTPLAVRELQLGVGGEVWVALKATEIQVDPA